MRREPGTVSPDRPGDSREGPVADHVAPGRDDGTFVHRIARHAENDRRKLERAYQNVAGGWFCFGHEDLSESAAPDDLLTDAGRPARLRALH